MTSLLALLSLFALASCVTSSFQVASGPEAQLNKMVESIKKGGGIAVVGTGIDNTGREDLALKKAILDGRSQLAQTFETKMAVMEKDFTESVGGNGNSEINELFSQTRQALTKTTLVGSTSLSDPITKKSGNTITVKVVVGIEPRTMNSAVLSELQKNANPAIYERFRASQSFSEMQKAMAEYESSSGK